MRIFAAVWNNADTMTPAKCFWEWFERNEARLFAFEREQVQVFEELAAAMRQVHPDLTFEFGPVKSGQRDFVISAGGMKAAFPAVESLYTEAPQLPRWNLIKFRPRRSSLSDIEIGRTKIRAEDVYFLLIRDGEKVGVVLFFEDFTEEKAPIYKQIGYLFLDEALGEYVVETQVGLIDFQSHHSKYFEQASPLRELPARFDQARLGLTT